MPPRKKTKLEPDFYFNKSDLRNAIRAAREDFDPPFPGKDDDDHQATNDDDDDTDREHERDQDPEGNLEIAPGTKANTRLNTGYTSAYGQYIARSILIDLRGRLGLRTIALRGRQDQTTTTITTTLQQQQGRAQAVATHAQEQQ